MIRLILPLLLLPVFANAQSLRMATFNVELSRNGPGLLLRDIESGKDPQVGHVIKVIAAVKPDVLALQGVDWDFEALALSALIEKLALAGVSFDHYLHLRPNSGLATDLDLDGDRRTGGPGDAQGFGTFAGQGGIAVLSRFPILAEDVQDFSTMLWKDLPDATLPEVDGRPFPSVEGQEVQRLSSTAHWVVPIDAPSGRVDVMTFQAGPPVFDGPEDRNGLRNKGEILFWRHFLDGEIGASPTQNFVLLGGANLDPNDSDGHGAAMRALLDDPRLQDPKPESPGASQAGSQKHVTPDELDTVDWPQVGRLRVDYVLPSRDWTVRASGVYWPAVDQPGYMDAIGASRHRLVWADLVLKGPDTVE